MPFCCYKVFLQNAFKKIIKKIRLTILEVIYNAKTGHIGGSFLV